MKLDLLPDHYAICRFSPGADDPASWATGGAFFSVTRTINFALIDVLASLLVPLANVGLGIFSISTYETDYLILRDEDLQLTTTALQKPGHFIKSGAPTF